ncbi:flagellar hook-length control protein FliK [Azoarcus sp. TTM-91]|uniref:flagellar hook-length control protein FliK n=1 Tax=Azoarcus sp. TTM-91 TaxID=2691581 RepID=UPI00145CC14F|nr:flagellar hook-length control protein FliK [Azoarcus sp. TTM-91]NMG33185.1 flagellar hook-length control protein FliK [Azoarcus sp. TTM-91]
MPANVTQSSFSFSAASLLGSTSDATGTPRSATSSDSFSRMLAGQMSSTRSESRSAVQDTTASRSTERQQTRETQRESSRSRENDRTEASRQRQRSSNDNARASEPQQSTAEATDAKSAPPGSAKATKTSSEDTATTGGDKAAQQAATDAAAQQQQAAQPATALAGLPAAIAALMNKVAGEGAEGEAALADATDSGKPATTGIVADDTSGKSLQNPADALRAAVDAKVSAADKPNFAAQAQAQAAAATSSAADRPATALQAGPGEAGSALQGAAALTALRHQVSSPQSTTPQLPVQTPAGQNGWAEDVGNKVVWMLGRAESKAELVLTPPNMGKVEVSIHLNGDQTTAHFVAASQAARDALEQALPRLREMLQQSGISLSQADVSTSGEQQAGTQDGGGRSSGGSRSAGGIEGTEVGSAPVWVKQTEGMVDTFV